MLGFIAKMHQNQSLCAECRLKAFERRLTVLGLVLAAIAALFGIMQVVDRTVVTELALSYWNPLGLGALPAVPDAPRDAHLLLRFLGQLIIAALLVGPFMAILAVMFVFRERRGSDRVRT
jgi:hypothetical protein